MVKGIKSDDVCKVINKIPLEKRQNVKEISIDMANSMEKIASTCFSSASVVTDRFHVAQLVNEAVQEIRIKFRWKAIDKENKSIARAKKRGKKYISPTFENGDTRKQLLARSRYLLFKSQNKWTESQKLRAEILFREYPDIKRAYDLSMMFRNIYETSISISQANEKFLQWNEKVKQYDFDSFITAAESINNHKDSSSQYFMASNIALRIS